MCLPWCWPLIFRLSCCLLDRMVLRSMARFSFSSPFGLWCFANLRANYRPLSLFGPPASCSGKKNLQVSLIALSARLPCLPEWWTLVHFSICHSHLRCTTTWEPGSLLYLSGGQAMALRHPNYATVLARQRGQPSLRTSSGTVHVSHMADRLHALPYSRLAKSP